MGEGEVGFIKMKWPRLVLKGRYKIDWLDITGAINCPLSEVKPAPCWSEGILVKNTKDYIVLASSQYTDEGKDPVGDYTCIIKGAVIKAKRL